MYRIDSTKEKPDAKGLLESVAKMMNRGIRVGNVEALYDTCIEIQERWKKDIKQKYNISNPNSSAQVISYLDSLNDARVVEVCTSNGKWTSNKQVMLELSYYGYDIGTDIVGYRTAKKYADSIKSIIDAKDSSNLIHPSVTLTKTNRISYKEPALMNIPKQLLWDVVVPYKPGSVLISADIKNQEPSILINANRVKSLQPALQADIGLYEAMFSKLPITCKLNVVFTDGMTPGVIDNDELRVMDVQPIYYTPKRAPFSGIHIGSMEGPEIQLIAVTNLIVPLGTMPVLPESIVAITEKGEMLTKASFELDKNAASFKKAIKSGGIVSIEGILTDVQFECTGVLRKEFKRAWNAMSYGASKPGVKAMCQHIDGEMLYDFFTKIPELKEYRSRCQKLASKGVQSINTYFGTELYAGEPNTKALRRVLLDLPIQGTAADILSLLVKHFYEEVDNRGYEGKLSIYYTRHDELIIEAAKEMVDSIGLENVVNIVRDIVEHQVDDWVPFRVDIEPVHEVGVSTIIESLDNEDSE